DQYRKQSKFVQIEETREFENLAEESTNHSLNDQVVHHAENPEELLTEKQTGEDVSAALRTAINSLDPLASKGCASFDLPDPSSQARHSPPLGDRREPVGLGSVQGLPSIAPM